MPVPIVNNLPVSVEAVALSSAARTATTTSGIFVNPGGCRGVLVILDCTVWASNFTVSINFVDPASGKAVAALTSANITGTGTTIYQVHPLITASANLKANLAVPTRVSVTVTASDASSNTYSAGLVWLP